MKKFFLIFIVLFLAAKLVYAQDVQQLIDQVLYTYKEAGLIKDDQIMGFSLWGLFASFVFGIIGFAAFIYGKKRSLFKPIIIGIVLMVYPYFIRGIFPLILTGTVLTILLYFFRR